ncbi:hypothetical protein PTSG_12496 [Salpingoeca rosetta]|uniref:Uncharacterized protein n=1 Tax=Salpingoeca rosetta (strain ATCC 50818 / BSB-021) TaxID=946362 RepID=F2UF14_SALR5|nr:uncharacterized protein PTSG_12496 [Salpingoeca rosetta]EGD75214.1 hypothetical protein PTSG_12496 [Salpingoeca rosetta]|eukprot:XP_004992267.1 hypothetical protein PTSG_12496 [Salpingoeca rosetta]
MAGRSATELGSALFTVLREANSPEKHTDEAFNNLLEYAFANIHLLRNMNEKQRIAAVWHLVELGGIPLIVNALQPAHKAMSMGMTLMGMLFKDENLLSHKLGRLILTNKKFLPAIEAGMQLGRDEMMPLLVCQVLHNVMRTASTQHLKEIAEHGRLAKQMLFLMQHSLETLKDWRLTYVTVDMILLLEIANAHETLDKLKHYDAMMVLLEKKYRPALTEHAPLLNRCLATLFLWSMRSRHSKDEALQARRQELFRLIAALKEDLPEAFKQPEEVDGKSPPSFHQAATTVNLCIALDELSKGDESHALPLHLTVKSRIRNWDAIEREAEQKVRSPDFKKMSMKQAGQGDKDKEAAPVVEVSSDESSDDGDSSDDDHEGDGVDEEQGASSRKRQMKAKAPPSAKGDKAPSATDEGSKQQQPAPARSEQASQPSPEVQAALQAAAAKKTEGTTYFRGAMYDDAFDLYSEALQALDAAPVASDQVNQERAKLLGNCAECRLREEKYDGVAELCDRALAADPTFTKAYFRKAKALKALGSLEAAQDAVRELLAVEPANKPATQLLQDIKTQLKEQTKQ